MPKDEDTKIIVYCSIGIVLILIFYREDGTMKIIYQCKTCELVFYPNGNYQVKGKEPGFMSLTTLNFEDALEYFLAEQEKAASVGAETAR